MKSCRLHGKGGFSYAFRSVARDGKRDLTTYRSAAQRIFSFDALAPTLASMLHADLAQRFFPGVLVRNDRATALEHGWEQAWMTNIEDRGSSEPFE